MYEKKEVKKAYKDGDSAKLNEMRKELELRLNAPQSGRPFTYVWWKSPYDVSVALDEVTQAFVGQHAYVEKKRNQLRKKKEKKAAKKNAAPEE